MITNGWIALSLRFYHELLRLYPQAYRAMYEMEMLRLFTNQCREAYQQQGRLGILFLWPRTLVDVGVTVVREHLSDPQVTVGLLDAKPNTPLPWKGVLLVLIPGLIFFVSQVAQVTSSRDWFFLVFYRAGYFLILPVLFIWIVTRRFPIWGLIPLGLLYETVWDYVQRVEFSSLPFFGRWFANDTMVLFDTQLRTYDVQYLYVTSVCVILLSSLIWHNARRWQISRTAWKWLGIYALVVVLGVVGEVYRATELQRQSGTPWTPTELREYLFQMSVWFSYDSLPFLLLIFIGMFFARKYQGFSFLVLLGYLLPTVIFGRYGQWSSDIPFYVVSLAVLLYRFVVALLAPVWLVRAASIAARQRAVAIPVVIAVICHTSLNFIVWVLPVFNFLDLALTVRSQLNIVAGLGLAVALYLPREKGQAIVSPPALVRE